LDGTLGGSLRVRAQPGREMVGTGTLEVGGVYSAYGQRLQVTRGRLSFNGPISDPRLDIRAERRIEAHDITAGISVTGRASAPQVQIWTDPASDDSQALSWLALGRPLSNLSSSEGRQLDAASAALTAGGSMLAGSWARGWGSTTPACPNRAHSAAACWASASSCRRACTWASASPCSAPAR